MAHVRKDTLIKPPEWWKHLKWNKRVVSKAERKAARKFIDGELLFGTELSLLRVPVKFSLRND